MTASNCTSRPPRVRLADFERLRTSLGRAVLGGAVLAGLLLPGGARAQTAADSSLIVSWTAPGDNGTTGTATAYDLRYRTAPVVGTDTLSWWNAATRVSGLPAPRPAGSVDSIRVRGLVPLTTYYFILRTADEVPNWSTYSNVGSMITSGDTTPPGAIADLGVTGTTGTSITLHWTAPGNDGSTGTAASYDVRYSSLPITAANWALATVVAGEPVPAVAGTAQTFTIPGLQGSVTYYAAIKTTDTSGNVSLLSNVVSATTLDVIPPAAVRDLTVQR